MQSVKSASLVWRVSKSGVRCEEEEIDHIHCQREQLNDVKALFSMSKQRDINQLISDWNKEESVLLFPEHKEFSAAVLEEEFHPCEKNESKDNDEDLFPRAREVLGRYPSR